MKRLRLPWTIVALGLTSFFTDVGSEMIFPLLPLFMTETLRAGPGFLGLVEGAADTVASLLKLASGWLADRLARRKPLVVLGYGIASVVRPFMALAAAPWHVLAIRLTDRVGKGIRTSPRDALIADAAQPGQAGRAFGFHRAMDHAGAVVGPLIAAALLARGVPLRTVFWIAAIPGAAALAVVLAIREPRVRRAEDERSIEPLEHRALPRRLRAYLGILCAFSMGNSSDAFLLLRARDLGLSAAMLPLLWTLLHVVKLFSSYWGGALSDRVPRIRMIIGGWLVYAGVYLGLGLARGPVAAWALFAAYGLYYGLTEPAEKALVRDLAPASSRGRAFGAYNFVVGVSALPASLLTGMLWRSFGAEVALAMGAALAAAASAALLLWARADRARGRVNSAP